MEYGLLYFIRRPHHTVRWVRAHGQKNYLAAPHPRTHTLQDEEYDVVILGTGLKVCSRAHAVCPRHPLCIARMPSAVLLAHVGVCSVSLFSSHSGAFFDRPSCTPRAAVCVRVCGITLCVCVCVHVFVRMRVMGMRRI